MVEEREDSPRLGDEELARHFATLVEIAKQRVRETEETLQSDQHELKRRQWELSALEALCRRHAEGVDIPIPVAPKPKSETEPASRERRLPRGRTTEVIDRVLREATGPLKAYEVWSAALRIEPGMCHGTVRTYLRKGKTEGRYVQGPSGYTLAE